MTVVSAAGPGNSVRPLLFVASSEHDAVRPVAIIALDQSACDTTLFIPRQSMYVPAAAVGRQASLFDREELQLRVVEFAKMPHASNGGEGGGRYVTERVYRRQAWDYRLLQLTSTETSYTGIALDCDNPGATWDRLRFDYVPAPNWITENRRTGHLHLVYTLKVPVHKHDAARLAPQQYLAGLSERLQVKLHGDPGYAGFLTRNPFHEQHVAFWGRTAPYELPQLADYVEGVQRPKRIVTHVGRNVTLFRAALKWARQNWENDEPVRAYLDGLHGKMYALLPLPESELRSIAKSVERYRSQWRLHGHKPEFIELQRQRGLKSGKARRARVASRDRAMLEDRAAGCSFRELAARYELSVGGAYNAVKRAKNGRVH